jgi:hypothetical protein
VEIPTWRGFWWNIDRGAKGALKKDGKTPLSLFEKHARNKPQVSDEEKEVIISLLGGL